MHITEAKCIRFMGWMTVLMFLATAFSAYSRTRILIFRIEVLAIGLIFGLILFYARRRVLGIIFFGLAVIFNPIIPFHFERGTWQILDIAAAVFTAVFALSYIENYEKGERFQKYIEKLFPAEYWNIADRTKDFTDKLGRLVLSDMNPDFTFQNIASKQRFAVECKYRSRFFDYKGGKGIKWDYRKGKRYEQHGRVNNLPVFVAFGVGGKPSRPDRLFVVPIGIVNSCQYGFVSDAMLKPYEKIVSTPFLRNLE